MNVCLKCKKEHEDCGVTKHLGGGCFAFEDKPDDLPEAEASAERISSVVRSKHREKE